VDPQAAPDLTAVALLARRVRAAVEQVIVGKPEVIDQALVAVLCEGHILIEDVPGIGKTKLAKALARSLGCSFRRLQCTPDLLPGHHRFGILQPADTDVRVPRRPRLPINRATRGHNRRCSGMEERQVTVEGRRGCCPGCLSPATQSGRTARHVSSS
jgi:MoxR-like ATPase